MNWIYLFLAILFEVTGTTNMKVSQGFTKIVPSILIFVFYGLSFTSFTYALKKIDISIAYPIWSGLGTLLIAGIGVLLFKETITPIKIVSIVLIIIGVIGLKLSGGTQ
ncbi:MAG TPA: DMT family transporter [Candidatus Brocadiaceae bacterium]